MFDITPVTSRIHNDCGATCLQMLLKYYGIEVDLATLSKECETNFCGCTARGIIRAARKHGLELKAWKELEKDEEVSPDAVVISVETLEQDRPSIVWWNYNHFCILCGKDENGKIVIINPDRGRYRMTEGTFNAMYSGVSICEGIPDWLDKEKNSDGD